MDWRKHISVDPEICHGAPCIKGTRVLVSVLLDNQAAGSSYDEIVLDYPAVTRNDLRATVTFAAELAKYRTLPLPDVA